MRRLLRALRDYDTMTDLMQILHELPPDLESLYKHMLGNMLPRHRRQGSRLLQIMLRNLETHGHYPLTLLQLSFAEERDCLETIGPLRNSTGETNLQSRLESTEGRVRSPCCGLLEVRQTANEVNPSAAVSVVTPFHRTVVDFLKIPEIWQDLKSLIAESDFDTNQTLLMSSLEELRITSCWSDRHSRGSPAICSILRFLTYMNAMEDIDGPSTRKFLRQLYSIAACVWYDNSLFKTPEAQAQAVGEASDRFASIHKLSHHEKFILYALSQCHIDQMDPLFAWIQTHSASDLDISHYEKSMSLALWSQFINEEQSPVRILLCKNIVPAAGHIVLTCIALPKHSVIYRDLSWKQMKHEPTFSKPCQYWMNDQAIGSNSSCFLQPRRSKNSRTSSESSNDLTLSDMILSYAEFLATHPAYNFFHSTLPTHFLDVLIPCLKARVDLLTSSSLLSIQLCLSKLQASVAGLDAMPAGEAEVSHSASRDTCYASAVTRKIDIIDSLLKSHHADPQGMSHPKLKKYLKTLCIDLVTADNTAHGFSPRRTST